VRQSSACRRDLQAAAAAVSLRGPSVAAAAAQGVCDALAWGSAQRESSILSESGVLGKAKLFQMWFCD